MTPSPPASELQPHSDSIAATNTTATETSLDRDLFCFACGYNLRGLAADGTCPECGVSVAESLAGDTLAAADPRWLRKLRIGIVLLLLGPLVSLAATLPVMRGRQLTVIAGLCSPETYRLLLVEELFRPGVVAWLLPAGSVLTAMAVWLLTARWPWARHDPRAQRLALRILAILGGGVAVAFYVERSPPFIASILLAARFLLPSTVLDLAQAGLLLHYFAALARRSRDARLPARFNLLCILATARMVIVLIGLCVLYWRTSAYMPVFWRMVMGSLGAAPLLAVAETLALMRLWRAMRRWTV